MEASIDGVQWTAASATANKTSVGQLNTLIVAGAKANADVLTMSLANSSGVFKVGTYDLSGDVLVSMSFTYGTDIAASYLATTGTVEIASINEDTVKGTFVFTATNLGGESITVTSGSFDVGYGINIHLLESNGVPHKLRKSTHLAFLYDRDTYNRVRFMWAA